MRQNEPLFVTHFPIALVVSRFNEAITSALYDGAMTHLLALGFSETQITTVWVPGAVEIPLAVQRLIQTDRYEAVVALGAVIRGETSHYDFVCQQVSYGCQKVALENDIPVLFGILTTEDEAQAFARVGGACGHKGIETIDAACQMVAALREIE